MPVTDYISPPPQPEGSADGFLSWAGFSEWIDYVNAVDAGLVDHVATLTSYLYSTWAIANRWGEPTPAGEDIREEVQREIQAVRNPW
jgi:hypothetical protein